MGDVVGGKVFCHQGLAAKGVQEKALIFFYPKSGVAVGASNVGLQGLSEKGGVVCQKSFPGLIPADPVDKFIVVPEGFFVIELQVHAMALGCPKCRAGIEFRVPGFELIFLPGIQADFGAFFLYPARPGKLWLRSTLS